MTSLLYAWSWVAEHSTVLATVVSAISTGTIAVFTIYLVKATNEQGRLTQQSIDLAREEYIASHRPAIRVRGFQWDGNELSEDDAYGVLFQYVNVGDSSAKVREIGTTIAFTAKPDGATNPPEVLKFDVIQIQPPISLASGERELGGTDARFPWGTDPLIKMARERAGYVYCLGYLIYSDENGVERRTGFCRRFNFPTARWEIVEDAEYEYQD